MYACLFRREKYGISNANFYKHKAQFGGMTVWDAQRLLTLEGKTPS
ncbi:hypothetical protein OCH7691_03447 [Oceanibacterium hippocampi]|uniref:Uncharacterized protein n=1 Tax=Oceanibacterium hippocampi TaxID=745714 RepID=A0A1Y5TZL3_9PROT|nr:hypothetical protein OCH7691_03447 [Oceanibacterium hippocampi]